MKVTASVEMVETDFAGQQIQAQRQGMVKVHSKELLCACDASGFEALCRCAGGLLARALAGDDGGAWPEECDSAMTLAEAPAAAALKAKGPALDVVLHSMLSFLQQVCVATPRFNVLIEHRRLQFLSACGPFFKLWKEEILQEALARVLARLKEPSERETREAKLEQRALDTLIGICKSGAVKAQHLEALNSECHALVGRVSSGTGRGKLIEALTLAVASCEELDYPRRVQLVQGIMEQVTLAWHNAEMQSASPSSLLEAVANAAEASTAPRASQALEETGLAQLKDTRTMLATFVGLVSRTASATPAARNGLADAIVAEWAPGIFGLLGE
ncbi:unnamed protein product, partial [Effrenium voratum]